MTTTMHEHHLVAPNAECLHTVCIECPTYVLRSRHANHGSESVSLRFTITQRALPVVGQSVQVTTTDGTVYLGHVTSLHDFQFHAHLRPLVTKADIDRWFPHTADEKTALAHLRGWDHFGPQCPLCKAGGQ